MKTELNSIKALYRDAEIFITGASGFIGKVLVEKLLRSCPDVKKIYLLMRAKKGQKAETRIQQLTDNLLFANIKQDKPELLSKLQVIEGDVKELRLGISSEDYETIKSCTIIIHLAACVRFDDHLKAAILLNTRGTREICELARSMPCLKSFVHVSTAYVQPKIFHIEEKSYTTGCDWRTYIDYAENLELDLLNILMPKLTSFAPNTYTFTKLLAEQICHDYKRDFDLPIVIYRPSIVSFTDFEFPGWCDNLNGPNALFAAYFSGIKRVFQMKQTSMDIVPVDLCVKGMLVASAKHQQSRAEEVPIYNAASMVTISINELIELSKPLLEDHLFKGSIGLPSAITCNCQYYSAILKFFLQIIPAMIIDLLLRAFNKKPMLMRYQRKAEHAERSLQHFSRNKFTFDTDNYLSLGRNLCDIDKNDFCMKMKSDKFEYFRKGYIVSKEIILNETAESAAIAKKRAPYYKLLSFFMKATFVAILYKISICCMKKVLGS